MLLSRLSGFPLSTKTEDVVAIFTDALSCDVSSIEVTWVDDFSVFVIVSQEILARFSSDKAIQEVLQQKLDLLQQKIDEEAKIQAEELLQSSVDVIGDTEIAGADGTKKAESSVEIPRRWDVALYSDYLESKLAIAEARLSETGQTERPFKKVRLV